MIVVIDYGLGNLASVANALDKLKIPYKISSDGVDMEKATALILPGVGAAGVGMNNLKKAGLDKVLLEQASKGKPILGICLGMQLLMTSSEEDNTECLGLIPGKVIKFKTDKKIPHMGWNQVDCSKKSKVLKGLKDNDYFYFVHSFYCQPEDANSAVGITEYDEKFCSVMESSNIFGAQFHPEKSSTQGLKILDNFWRLAC